MAKLCAARPGRRSPPPSPGWARAAHRRCTGSLSPADAQFGGWYLRGDVGIGVNSTAPELKDSARSDRGRRCGRVHFRGCDPGRSATRRCRRLGWSTSAQAIRSTAGFAPTPDIGARARLQSLYAGTDPGRLARRNMPIPIAPTSPRSSASSTAMRIWEPGTGSRPSSALESASPTTGYPASPTRVWALGIYLIARPRLATPTDRGASFAWALMAGVDFDLTPNLRLELGYRYLNYGSIATGGSNCLMGGSGGTFSTANCSAGVANTISSPQQTRLERLQIGAYLLDRRGSRCCPSSRSS